MRHNSPFQFNARSLLMIGVGMAAGIGITVYGQDSRDQNETTPKKVTRTAAPNTANKAANNTNDNAKNTARRDADDAKDSAQNRQARRSPAVQFEAGEGDKGLRVGTIENGSPAARSGFQTHDSIVSADGRTFKNSRQLNAYLLSHGGRRIPVIVERGGKRYTVQYMADFPADKTAWLGAFLEQADDDKDVGARITQVYPSSPAARAGLQPNDVIVKIGDQNVASSSDVIDILQNSEAQAQVNFNIRRGEENMDVPVVLGSRQEFAGHRPPMNQYGPDYGHEGDATQNQNQNQNQGVNDAYSNVPPYAMQLENDRRTAEQHQRIEQEIQLLREEIKQLRAELQKK